VVSGAEEGFTKANLHGALSSAARQGDNAGTREAVTIGTLGSDLTQARNKNYQITVSPTSFIEITRRNVSVVANDVSAIYGDTISLNGLRINGGSTYQDDVLSVTLSTTAQKGKDVGSYDIVAMNDLAASNPNYNITFNRGFVTITPRSISVKLMNQFEYGDQIDLSQYEVTGAEDGFLRSNLHGSLETSARQGDQVGTRSIVTIGTLGLDKKQARNKNYLIVLDPQSMVEIKRRNVTVVADSLERLGGEENPALTYRFANGRGTYNNERLSGSLATDADKNAPIGDYRITRGTLGEQDINYNIAFDEGTLRVVDKASFASKWQLDYQSREGLGGLKVGYRIGGSNFYTRAVGIWDGTIIDGEKPAPSVQPRLSDIMVCTNPESDCSLSITGKDRQAVIFAR
jgi:hypothetical protein